MKPEWGFSGKWQGCVDRTSDSGDIDVPSVPVEGLWEHSETGQSPAGQSEEPIPEKVTRTPDPVGG